jgi:hypothetical protein
VFGSDGSTPVANAAVNLFPDPDSRELGRGVFSDTNGRFAFQGVPLGAFTVEAVNSAGRTRTVSGALLESGQLVDVPVCAARSRAASSRPTAARRTPARASSSAASSRAGASPTWWRSRRRTTRAPGARRTSRSACATSSP